MKNNKIDARKEYCEYIYNRIINKLTDAKEYQLLSFALLGIYLGLRQNDILGLKWEQVEFDNYNLKNVSIKKGEREMVVDSFRLESSVIEILETWYELCDDKINIFPKLKRYETGNRIGELIGDTRFCNHDLRSMGVCLRTEWL